MFIVIQYDTRRWIRIEFINIARLHVAIIWITHNKEIITIYSIFHDRNECRSWFHLFFYQQSICFINFFSSSVVFIFLVVHYHYVHYIYITLYFYTYTSESFLFIIRALKISAFAPQNTSLSSRGSMICKYISRLHKSLEQQSRRK